METKDQDVPLLSLIQKIKDGSVDPRSITKDQRLQCVLILWSEGYNESSIAQVLNRSEKTIRRDLSDIRSQNALSPDPNLARELVGEMLQKARAHQSRLLRISSNKENKAFERIQAEYAAWRIERELIERMQSLGYMPQRPQELFLTREENDQSLEEISQTMIELEAVVKENGTVTPEFQSALTVLQEKLEKAKLNEEAQKLLIQQKEANNSKESTDDK